MIQDHRRGGNASGIAFMLIACAMFVAGDSCIKVLGRTMALGEIIFFRGLLALPIVLFIAVNTGVLAKLPEALANRRLQVRTVFEVGSTILFLAGLIRMTYADAIAIQQFVPLAVIAGAALFLGEPVGWRRWLAALVGLIGVLIVIRPGSGTLNWPAMMVLDNVVCVAGRDLITRRIGAVPTVLVAIMSIAGVGLSGLLLLPFEPWRMPTAWEWLLILIAAVTSAGGFYWVTEALRRGDVAVVMPFRYSLIPYGVLSGILIFGEWPDRTTMLGIAIVLGAGLYALNRERIRAREAAKN
jgi:drug/metabolite transporter (DMT)-like permease